MAADGSIIINTRILTDGFDAGAKKIKIGLNGLTSTLMKFGAVVGSAFAIKKVVDFGKEAVSLGSDLQEVQNVVNSVFTSMSDHVDEFAHKAATTAGLSETMAKRYVGTFGAMAKSFGFAEGEALNISTALTQLSGDLASFYNITQDEAYTKLKSVFTGETESLKELGVVMTQSALDAYAMTNGFGKTTSAMTEQEKVALRYQFVMNQLSTASGDFVKTSDSWANQVRVLQLQIESLKATVGAGLINIFTPVIKVINVLLSKLATVANAFKAFTELITGKKSSGGSTSANSTGIEGMSDAYSSATQSADDYSKATNNVAKATKKANKEQSDYLSGLDEIRKYTSNAAAEITTPSTGGTGGIDSGVAGLAVDYGSLATGETVVDELNDKVIAFKDVLLTIFEPFERAWKKNGENVISSFRYALNSLGGMISSIGTSFAKVWTNGTGERTLSLLLNIASNIVRTVGNLAKQFKKAWDTNETGTRIIQGISNIVNSILRFVDRIAKATSEWAENLDFYPLLESVNGLLEAMQPVVETLAEVLAEIYQDIILPVGKYLIEKALPKIIDLITELLEYIGDHKEGVKAFGKALLGAFAAGKLALKILAIKKSLDGLIGKFADVTDAAGKVSKKGFVLRTIISGLDDIAAEASGSMSMLNTSVLAGVFALGGGIIGTVALTEKIAALVETIQGGNGVLSSMGGSLNDITAAMANVKIITSEQQESIRALIDANEDMGMSASEMAESIIREFGNFGVSAEQLNAVLSSTGTQFTITAENAEILNSLVSLLGDGMSETAGLIDLSSIDIMESFDGMKQSLTDLWREGILADDIFYELDWTLSEMKASGQTAQTALDTVVTVLEDAGIPTEGFIELLGEKLPGALTTVETTATQKMEGTAKTVEDNMKAAEDSVKTHTEEMAKSTETATGDIATDVSSAFGGTAENTETNWNASNTSVQEALNAMKSASSSSMRSIFKNVESYTNSIWNITSNNWDAIAQKIEGVMYSASTSVANAFQSMRGNIINEMNRLIYSLNHLQSSATTVRNRIAKALSFDISFPSPVDRIVGYSRISMNIPKTAYPSMIPYLATGAVIPPNSPFLAMLGDQKNGTNIEAPLETIKQAVAEVVGNKGSTYHFVGQLNGRTLFEEVIEEGKEYLQQTGRNPFELVR